MNEDIDLEKYRIKDFSSQANQYFDLEQYRLPEKKTKNIPSTSYVKIPGLAAKGAVSGAAGIPGNLLNIGDYVAQQAEKGIYKLFGSEPPERPEGLDKIRVPTTQDLNSLFEYLFPSLKPETSAEKQVQDTGEILGSLATGNPEEILSKTGLLSRLSAALFGGEGKSYDLGPIGEFASMVVGGSLPTMGLSATSFGRPASELSNKIVNPKAKGKELARAAEEEGIQLPKAALNEGSFIENRLMRLPFSSDVYDEFFKRFYKDYKNSWERSLNKISPTKFRNREEAGLSFKENLDRSIDLAQEESRLLYKKAENEVAKKNLMMPTKNLERKADYLYKELDKSLSKSNVEKTTQQTLQEIMDNLYEIANSKGEIPIDVGIATKRSVNQKIDWNELGGPQKLLRSLVNDLKNDLYEGLKKDKKALKFFKAAEGNHADMVDIYRNDLMESIRKNEKPELVLNKMDSVSNIKKMEKALSNTVESKEAFQALKRFRLKQLLQKKLFSKGQIKHGTAASALEDPESMSLIKELAGPEAYVHLKNIQKISEGLEKGFNKFGNPSRTAEVLHALGHIGIVTQQFWKAFSEKSLPGMVLAVGEASLPYILSKIYTNPSLLGALQKASAAGLQNNPQRWGKYIAPAIEEIAKYIEESQSLNHDNQ